MVERIEVHGTGRVASTFINAMRARHWHTRGSLRQCKLFFDGQVDADDAFEPHDDIHYLHQELLPTRCILALGFAQDRIVFETLGHNPSATHRAFSTLGWLNNGPMYMKPGFMGYIMIEPVSSAHTLEQVQGHFPRCLWSIHPHEHDLGALVREIPILIERLFIFGAFCPPDHSSATIEFMPDEYETLPYALKMLDTHLRWEQQPCLMTKGVPHPAFIHERAPSTTIDMRLVMTKLQALARSNRRQFLEIVRVLGEHIRPCRLTIAEILLRAEIDPCADGEKVYNEALDLVDRVDQWDETAAA